MATQKQSRLDLLDKRMKIAMNILQGIAEQQEHLKTLASGTMQTIKLMPGYDDAIEQLRVKMIENETEEQALKDLASSVEDMLTDE